MYNWHKLCLQSYPINMQASIKIWAMGCDRSGYYISDRTVDMDITWSLVNQVSFYCQLRSLVQSFQGLSPEQHLPSPPKKKTFRFHHNVEEMNTFHSSVSGTDRPFESRIDLLNCVGGGICSLLHYSRQGKNIRGKLVWANFLQLVNSAPLFLGGPHCSLACKSWSEPEDWVPFF